MEEDFCEAVAQTLRESGVNAVAWDSGGGMLGVGIGHGDQPPDELRFFFGTAGEVWEAEVLDTEGETVDGISTTVAADSENAREVAAGILQALAAFVGQR